MEMFFQCVICSRAHGLDSYRLIRKLVSIRATNVFDLRIRVQWQYFSTSDEKSTPVMIPLTRRGNGCTPDTFN